MSLDTWVTDEVKTCKLFEEKNPIINIRPV